MMGRIRDEGKDLQFITTKDLLDHYAAVRKRLQTRQKIVEKLKPPDITAHFIEPLRFSFTNGVLIDPDLRPPLTILQIIRTVAHHYHIHPDIITGPCRVGPILIPRHVAMYLCRKLTLLSYPQIGRRFGGRDHSTIIHGIHKIEEMMKGNTKVREDIHSLESVLDDNPVWNVESKEAAPVL